MERKYLRNALEKCIVCFDQSTKDDCSARCAEQYFSFMKLKEFYIGRNGGLKFKDLAKLEKILDTIWLLLELEIKLIKF